MIWNLILIAAGLAVREGRDGGVPARHRWSVAWMITVGAGLYLAYTPFNALLFDRLMAATAAPGNAGFLIYVADTSGYAGSVALLLIRSFGHVRCGGLSSSPTLPRRHATCGLELAATLFGGWRLLRSLPTIPRPEDN